MKVPEGIRMNLAFKVGLTKTFVFAKVKLGMLNTKRIKTTCADFFIITSANTHLFTGCGKKTYKGTSNS